MILEPNCHKRKCKHYIGVSQPDGTEQMEVNVCQAFPNGIPDEIAYGKNRHLRPYPGDNGIRYERERRSRKV